MAVKINEKVRAMIMKSPKLAKKFLGKEVETPKVEEVVNDNGFDPEAEKLPVPGSTEPAANEDGTDDAEPETTEEEPAAEPEATVEETPAEPDVPADDPRDDGPEATVEEPVVEDDQGDAIPENEPVDYSKMSKAALLVAMPDLGFTVDQMAGKTKAQLLELMKA